jgi:methyl-accepting chemotaxis protein
MSSRRVWILIIGGLTLITLGIGWSVNKYLIDERIAAASDRLLLLSNLRGGALQRYFSTAEAELRFWSSNQALIDQQIWMNEAWNVAVDAGRDPEARLKQFYVENKPDQQEQTYQLNTYPDLHAKLHPLAKAFVVERGYYDLFLISPTGNVHYTVDKEDDFGTNLYTGKYKDSGLAEVFKRALKYARTDAVAISDMQPYAASNGAPAMFVAKAMYGEVGQLAGVIALQLPTKRIVDIMNFDAGMRETGETYLVGTDLLMRSNSRFSEASTILETKVDTTTVQRALLGEYGVQFATDYRGAEVLSAYSSIEIDESTWAVMAEIDKAEVLEPETNAPSVLVGLMLFFYSLGIWSSWYIQRSSADADSVSLLADLDLDGGMDMTDS